MKTIFDAKLFVFVIRNFFESYYLGMLSLWTCAYSTWCFSIFWRYKTTIRKPHTSHRMDTWKWNTKRAYEQIKCFKINWYRTTKRNRIKYHRKFHSFVSNLKFSTINQPNLLKSFKSINPMIATPNPSDSTLPQLPRAEQPQIIHHRASGPNYHQQRF